MARKKKVSLAHLEKEYSTTQKGFRVLFLFGFVVMSFLYIRQIFSSFSFDFLFPFSVAFLFAVLTADFLSGVVHWAADTWGNVDWPVVGRSIIQSFRLHHVDQKGITRHDFLQTNADVAFVVFPVQLLSYLFLVYVYPSAFLFAFFGSLTIVGFFTNQIHKWAHQDTVPAFIAFLQKCGFILSPEHHVEHHTAPYAKHYCITFGWMNSFLLWIHFFPFMEYTITSLTGALPREDGVDETLARLKK